MAAASSNARDELNNAMGVGWNRVKWRARGLDRISRQSQFLNQIWGMRKFVNRWEKVYLVGIQHLGLHSVSIDFNFGKYVYKSKTNWELYITLKRLEQDTSHLEYTKKEIHNTNYTFDIINY